MTRKLGVPGCPKCHGEGLIPATTVIRETADGRRIEYPTSRRCVCIATQAPDPSSGSAEQKPDAQSRAAGEKE